MRPEVKGHVLKEYGSWSVLTISSLIGVGVSRTFSWTVIPLFLSLAVLVNSKQSLMKWLRRPGDRTALGIFLGQVVLGAAILFILFGSDVPRLLPLLIIPAAYLLSNKIKGEHFILTELLGFTLLGLAAVLAKFLLTNGLDVRLFVGVSLYFTAGVFKIKAVLLKKMQDRVLAVLHIIAAIYAYHRFHIAVIILLPLIENMVMVVALYNVRLRTTGWIEVAKSLAVLGLFTAYY